MPMDKIWNKLHNLASTWDSISYGLKGMTSLFSIEISVRCILVLLPTWDFGRYIVYESSCWKWGPTWYISLPCMRLIFGDC